MESRPGQQKRPQLSDLRESGAIEQDADIVSFIYRPEYYKITEWDDESGTPTAGQAEFIVAKHRNGGLDSIRLKFEGHLGRFANLEEYDSGGYLQPIGGYQEISSKLNENLALEALPMATPTQAFKSTPLITTKDDDGYNGVEF